MQDTLDGTRPALTRARRPFDRRRYAYLVLTLSALGRSGGQIALSELADAVAADAGRIDGLGMDTGRKADRDAFVDAVAWLEARGALRMADGSAAEWVNDPERAEALYDIDREVVARHLRAEPGAAAPELGHRAAGRRRRRQRNGPAQGIKAQRSAERRAGPGGSSWSTRSSTTPTWTPTCAASSARRRSPRTSSGSPASAWSAAPRASP